MKLFFETKEKMKEDFFNDNNQSKLLKKIIKDGVDDSNMPLELIEKRANRIAEENDGAVLIYLGVDGCFYMTHYYGHPESNRWEREFDSEEIIPIELVYPEDGEIIIKKNSRLDRLKEDYQEKKSYCFSTMNNGKKAYLGKGNEFVSKKSLAVPFNEKDMKRRLKQMNDNEENVIWKAEEV